MDPWLRPGYLLEGLTFGRLLNFREPQENGKVSAPGAVPAISVSDPYLHGADAPRSARATAYAYTPYQWRTVSLTRRRLAHRDWETVAA